MADAKICDRCGAYYSQADSRDIALTEQTRVTTTISPSERQPLGTGSGLSTGPRKERKTVTVDTLDLCADCHGELLEWWQDGEEVSADG